MEKIIRHEKLAHRLIAVIFLATIGIFAFILLGAQGYEAQQPEGQLPNYAMMLKETEAELRKLQGNYADMESELSETLQEIERLASIEASLTEGFTLVFMGDYHTTAYCCEEYKHICGGNGITASGTKPTPGITVATDWSVLPPGTWIYIEGIGIRRVEDSGSAILGNRLDVAVDTHQNALSWYGFGNHRVWRIDINND